MENISTIFSNHFYEFRKDKIQLIFFVAWTVVTLAWSILNGMGLSGAEYWEYPRQVAPVLGIVIAGGPMIVIFALVFAKHRENGYVSSVKPISYFLGVGAFYAILNMIMAVYIALVGAISGLAIVNFIILVLLATICAMLIGAIIAVLAVDSKTALMASYPFALVFVLVFKYRNGVPAFQMANPIRPFISWFYMERVNHMLVEVHTGDFLIDALVVLGNIAVLVVVVAILHKVKNNNLS